MSGKIMLLLGGAWHDFKGYEAAAVPLFSEAGYTVVPTYEADDLTSLDESVSAVVVYTSYGGVTDRDGNVGTDLNDEQISALKQFVTDGGGLFGVHCATVNGNPYNEIHKLYGGRFVDHPPMFNFSVIPMRISHPVTDGVGEFAVYDEFYIQDLTEDSLVLMTAYDRGVCHPMAWVRTEGDGRVACIAPGHDAHAWDLPAFKKLSLQSLQWVARS